MSRTKSVQAHGKVLEAALELFAERGIEATSMDAITESSGVSKATIYKHWTDKDALALEALSQLLGLQEEYPRFETGNLQADLTSLLSYHPAGQNQELRSRIMPHVIAYSARNREFGDKWRQRAMERPRIQLRALLQRSLSNGELPKDFNFDVSLALLFGPMLYQRIFLSSPSEQLPANFAAQVAEGFCRAYLITKARSQ